MLIPQQVTILKPHPLPKWRAAVKAVQANQRNALVLCMGESTTSGVGVGTGANACIAAKPLAYPDLLAQFLTASGLYASGSSFCNVNNLTAFCTLQQFDPRIAQGSGWVSNSGNKGLSGDLLFNNTTSNLLSFTPANKTDTFQLWHPKNVGQGTINVAVSGNLLSAINCNAALTYVSDTMSFALGANRWDMAAVSTAAVFPSCGIATNSTKKEVTVVNAGWGGGTMGNVADSQFAFSSLPAAKAMVPDLTILCECINDWVAGTALATFNANLDAVIAGMQSVGSDVLFVKGPKTSAASIAYAVQNPYLAEIDKVCAKYRVPVLDFGNALAQTWETANANGQMFDIYHPKNYSPPATMIGNYLLKAAA